ncbi:organic cation transporter protein-like isoform X2 [Cloeon dipterum]|uniref:organic cation transporter protein-like isoform X2 n=1 Tax=Cloeon dipterum TaxID=197152 RepID=UPI00321FD8A5
MGVNEDFDAMLHDIGACGLYQIRQYTLVAFAIMFSAVSSIGFVFTAAIVPHRCLIGACGDESETSPFTPDWLSEAVPFKSNGQPESCLMFQGLNATICEFERNVQERCYSWVMDGPERTIQTEFSLMCPENEWKLALVGTLNNLGVLIGLPISGFISDRYGRKTALVIALVSAGIFGLLKTAATSYIFFVILEMMEPMFGGNIYGISFILALEMVTPNKRVVGNMVIVFAYSVGNALMGLIAWAARDWRVILWATNAPALLFVLYIWVLPESVRWLMSRGRLGDAKKVVEFAAKLNKADLDKESMKDWQNGQLDRVDTDATGKGDNLWSSLRQVTKSGVLLLRLALCSFCWASVTLVYYGLSLNSVSLGGTENQYLNFILTSLVEAPSYLITWQCMNRLGRRRTLCLTFVASGIACFVNPFVPDNAGAARLPLYLFGKFAITGAFDTVYVFTAEIFPTKLRNSLLGTCSMVGRIGSMLAPQTPLLTKFSKFLPLALFGVVALVAGALALFLPESKGTSLPVTIKEAEEISKQRKKLRQNQEDIQSDQEATNQII